MKMLVSDYDGTFLPEPNDTKNINKNIQSISEFRKNGNIFVMSTGRPFKSIKKEIDKHGIEFDYLCCQDGAAIFNGNFELMHANYLTKDQITSIINVLKSHNTIEKYKAYTPICETEELENIIELEIKKNKLVAYKQIKAELEQIDGVQAFKLFNYIFIKTKCSKSKGIETLMELIEEDIERESVYTIGDNSNDLDMLQVFNGYKMLTSYPNLYFKGLKTTTNVHRLVKKIK